MRILYVDLDTTRPDHLGCYGYHRPTSPNLDRIAAQGVRFDNVYVSDAPCLPSRTSLFCGRFGIHNGVVDHAGAAAEPFVVRPDGALRSDFARHTWMNALRAKGYLTATISSFGERHAAGWWYAGFDQVLSTGKLGAEIADDVTPVALDWLRRNAARDNWFLHLNYWDVHTPYRTPDVFGEPYADHPVPAWYTEDIRRQHWDRPGPECAREAGEFHCVCEGVTPHPWESRPRQPLVMNNMREVKRMFDGYDTAVRYVDEHLGRVFAELDDMGVLSDTAIVVSADHGESLGELNNYACHMLADQANCRVPLIIRWPGVTDTQAGRVDRSLRYHVDFAATVLELTGAAVPADWDGQSFADSLRQRSQHGRPYLVTSHLAGGCQRSVRFDDFLCIRSYHDGYRDYPNVMLFDVVNDPHEVNDLASSRPDLVGKAMTLLDKWHGEMMSTAILGRDPLWTVMAAGGGEHSRGYLPLYLKRLRSTGRGQWADYLEKKFPRECRHPGG